jgi:hypothetical protein
MRASELILFAATCLLFAAPLFAVGGSVQALTRGLWLTVPCWVLGAVAMHLFAAPREHIHIHLFGPDGDTPAALSEAVSNPSFVRTGAALLAVAIGPVVTLVATSMALWNR